jgi:hypothetical protein
MIAYAHVACGLGRYCAAVLTPALHNVMETSCSEDSEFSLKGLVKGFNAYRAVGALNGSP